MPGANVIVFRDSTKQTGKTEFAGRLEAAMEQARHGNYERGADALVLAGQLESSLWDCGLPSAPLSSALTDALAQSFVDNSWSEFSFGASRWREILGSLPQFIRMSEPEGFSYYALHPGDFADEVGRSLCHFGPVALIGIRSVGSTLSAVAAATFRNLQIPASRITVRPTGHPYDRQTHFTPSQTEWIDQGNARRSTFLILDEGPGLSGSSFLSVAEGLLARGVAPDCIIMIGTRECSPETLCARDAVHRWSRFGWRKVGSRICARFSNSVSLAGGAWREQFLAPATEWPACWPEMESLRFLSRDRKSIFKFEGFGQTGMETLQRAQAVHEAGFGPPVESASDGMHAYERIAGKPLSRSELSSTVVDQIARYCAFRETVFRGVNDEGDQIRKMVEFNSSQEEGAQIELPPDCFQTRNAVIVDGRMQPHEWIRSADGEVLKVDAVRHGDDHFLPGPTDIAWDLAGAIVEWDLDKEAARYLLDRFKLYSGRNSVDQLPYFILAYSTFRAAYCTMAAQGTRGLEEQIRLQRSSAFYLSKAHAIGDVCRL